MPGRFAVGEHVSCLTSGDLAVLNRFGEISAGGGTREMLSQLRGVLMQPLSVDLFQALATC